MSSDNRYGSSYSEKSSGSTRRDFLATGVTGASVIALSSILSRPALASFGGRYEPIPSVEEPRFREFVLRGIDAAKEAGAHYADVRCTHTIYRSVSAERFGDSETFHVGIRALIDGYWGFAAGPVMNDDEIVGLATMAVSQARSGTLGPPRDIDLTSVSSVDDQHWIMPVEIDPLSVHPLELRDYFSALNMYVAREGKLDRGSSVRSSVNFMVQERAFGSTNSTYCTQRLYRTGGSVSVHVSREVEGRREMGGGMIDTLTPAGVGWELFQKQPIRRLALQLIQDIHTDMDLPIKIVDVGRFDMVLDSNSMASMISKTIGLASELDRALGYEANATGTSYLNDPFEMLDNFVVGGPLLTVTSDRSAPGSLATVKWDDEGVPPKDFKVVDEGILRNYHTTREGAGWFRILDIDKTAQKLPRVSSGSAYASTAAEAPLARAANLTMSPSETEYDFNDLVAAVPKGMAMRGLSSSMDFQQLHGSGRGRAYEIKDGKISARIANAAVLFRAPEFWKSLSITGGPNSARRYGLSNYKGEPEQNSYHSVTAVPGLFNNVTVIDPMRRV